jgi:hypothetical protein
MVSASGNTARLRFLAASLPAPGTAAVSTRMSDAPALVRERQRSLLAEHASPADRASADTSELPTAALFRRSGRITVESRACLVVLKLASLLERREDSRSVDDSLAPAATSRQIPIKTPRRGRMVLGVMPAAAKRPILITARGDDPATNASGVSQWCLDPGRPRSTGEGAVRAGNVA